MLIREAVESDAEEILAIRKRTIAEQNYFLPTSEEFHVDVEMQRSKIATNKQSGGVTLVAEDNGEVIAFLTFSRNQMKRLRHTGSFGMAIAEKYRNQGLGSKMLLHLIDWVKIQSGIEKVCLGVLSTNERAIAMYKKIGFVEEGREVRQVKLENGDYVDNVMMGLFI
ncbi:N-acetyltransferase family protein [Bacillus manliponensis]|uniref:GNAT family N-acetyltransferase n=1 Tax=Bacillus manliponensis TaxID=574376 RepID=UPI0035169F24